MDSISTFEETLAFRPKNDGPIDTHPSKEVPPKQLCDRCVKLNLVTLLSQETKDISIGCLAEYDNANCPFCAIVSQSVGLTWGSDWNIEEVCSKANTTVRLYMRSKSPFSTKINGRTQHPYPRLLLAIDWQPPNIQRNRAPIKEVDRVKNRFVIAEIESLPDPFGCSSLGGTLLPRREVGERIDVDLIQRWLEECKRHKHSSKSFHRKCDLFQSEHPFRLIDVVDRCLVLKNERCDYVALSYVWGPVKTILDSEPGTAPILLSTKNNADELGVPQALPQTQEALHRGGRIPRTVRDAMELTRQIGMRYLWVDTLCIMQDDPQDVDRLIGRMDDIYDHAAVTAIAAAGADADAGLWGISPRSGYPIQPERIAAPEGGSISLSLCPPSLCDEVRRLKWNTRGWTFQEQCLSQRVLYFATNEVYFNCSEVQWREGYDHGEKEGRFRTVDVRTGPPIWNGHIRKDPDPSPYRYLGDVIARNRVQSYQAAVQDYTRKELTKPYDILNAFEGIFNRFRESTDNSSPTICQTQGIPSQILYQSILWFPSNNATRRPRSKPDNRLSSWSWASWTGPVDFVYAESYWVSRYISHAIKKKAPLYAVITSWIFGEPKKESWCWSSPVWEAASQGSVPGQRIKPDEVARAKDYLKTVLGIDANALLSISRLVAPPVTKLSCGALGFVGACLLSTEFCFVDTKKDHKVRRLEVGKHEGEFRFDDGVEVVDELVPVVAGETITGSGTYSIVLGLATEYGVSRRVGIGFVYFSKDPEVARPEWRYKFFCLI
ncbi:HET-domain-containing protein [Aspergillus campestris IBT 28561]|uniref:HET-domain-containing protein n=1 Tax=Aspergillus campestris (strain IBT 28561) TaxID=1392248 RepID=A0A2I1D1N1_ASPC2|nr:HET-domain-containing protein [Aspergillus campestris IBT 28561]PKY03794.1 HET-domain-containing protein [Aspergillus campestris IBT 28561]